MLTVDVDLSAMLEDPATPARLSGTVVASRPGGCVVDGTRAGAGGPGRVDTWLMRY